MEKIIRMSKCDTHIREEKISATKTLDSLKECERTKFKNTFYYPTKAYFGNTNVIIPFSSPGEQFINV